MGDGTEEVVVRSHVLEKKKLVEDEQVVKNELVGSDEVKDDNEDEVFEEAFGSENEEEDPKPESLFEPDDDLRIDETLQSSKDEHADFEEAVADLQIYNCMAASDQCRIRYHEESPSKPNKKKKGSKNPEANLLFNLNSCSKSKDLSAALSLYDAAVTSSEVHLSQQFFQTLLYLCSASISDISPQNLAIDRGFEIFDRMVSSGIGPSEASVTYVARLAAAKGDGDYAFKLVKDIVSVMGISVPRLRTYAPALLCFCEKLEAEKAYEVEEFMEDAGIALDEA